MIRGRQSRLAPSFAVVVLTAGCALDPYRPGPFDPSFRPPVPRSAEPQQAAAGQAASEAIPVAAKGPLQLDEVLDSVTSRYPPYLSALVERDLASGRITQSMGAFDTNLAAKLGSTLQGYYEATTLQALVEQPLGTGDTLYGGYRISDGFLPAYDKDRTQDNGELVFGGRFPLFRDRSFDNRRARLRQAEIDAELADPTIARARIDFVRAASRTYYAWVAAGQRLEVARELLRLATSRRGDFERGVERGFLAPIDVTDNERLIAQRQVFLVRAERLLVQAALELSLFLRDGNDAPIVPEPSRLPPSLALPTVPDAASQQQDIELAIRQRPELRRLQLLRDRAEADRELAENQTLPGIDLIVEASRSIGDVPYNDITENRLFVGGELKLPVQRRDAFGRLEQAKAQLNRLRFEDQFARDRIVNEVADGRSALQAAADQITQTARNVELARELVAAEMRAFELGRSDLLRVWLREVQLADAQVLEVDARLEFYRADAEYRAVLGHDALPAMLRRP